MRSKCRYPTASIVVMIMTLGLILVLLTKAQAIIPIGGAIILVLAFTYVVAAVVCGVRFALGRAGVHRLAAAETWRGK